MSELDALPDFKGTGTSAQMSLARPLPAWQPDEYGEAIKDETAPGHPAGYIAGQHLIDAVNTALLLKKPLLLTGNPGTGKSELAQRIAWEFGISPVLRFEAQSLSEANDLFYRFDLVRHVAASHLARPAKADEPVNVEPRDFLSFGPLGKAILKSNPNPKEHEGLWKRAFPHLEPPRGPGRSVVLIDEIDKASRDFPNDLLNAIERLEIPIREVSNTRLHVNQNANFRPIIVITSNSERELPPPFLRRCVFCHIQDPGENLLRQILRARVFPETLSNGSDGKTSAPLPPLFERMLDFFVDHRDSPQASLAYACGPAELIDWSKAVRSSLQIGPGEGIKGSVAEQNAAVKRALGSLAKHRDDHKALLESLESHFSAS
jgi:MoxR-like ATPase